MKPNQILKIAFAVGGFIGIIGFGELIWDKVLCPRFLFLEPFNSHVWLNWEYYAFIFTVLFLPVWLLSLLSNNYRNVVIEAGSADDPALEDAGVDRFPALLFYKIRYPDDPVLVLAGELYYKEIEKHLLRLMG